jgi:hypothetical protein
MTLPEPSTEIGFYLFLFQTPHECERVATFAGADESALFHRFDGIAIGRQRVYFFIIFQPPQDWVAAERISFKLVSVSEGFVPDSFGLKGNDAFEQFVTMAKTWDYSRMGFVCEVSTNRKVVYLNLWFWAQFVFSAQGVDAQQRDATIARLREAWDFNTSKYLSRIAAELRQPRPQLLVWHRYVRFVLRAQHPDQQRKQYRGNPNPQKFTFEDGETSRRKEPSEPDWRNPDGSPWQEITSVVERRKECDSEPPIRDCI